MLPFLAYPSPIWWLLNLPFSQSLFSSKTNKYNNYDKALYIVSCYPQFPQQNLFTRLFTCAQATSPWTHQKTFLKLAFPKGLTNNEANLTEPHNQDIKVQVTTKDIKRKTCFTWNPHPQRHRMRRVFFQIQLPISGINFSIIIFISLVRVNMRETEHDKTFETS